MSNMSWLNLSIWHVFVFICVSVARTRTHARTNKKKHIFTHSINRTGHGYEHIMHTHTQSYSSNNNAGVFLFSHQKSAHTYGQINENLIQFLTTTHIKSVAASKHYNEKKRHPKKRNLEIWWKPFCVSWYSCNGNTLYKCKQMKWKKPFFNECWKWKHSSIRRHTHAHIAMTN